MTSSSPNIIAIDGPAASGKSTLGRSLAQTLGYIFFDTGVMYRAVTYLALQFDMDLRDEAVITKLAQDSKLDVRPATKEDGRANDIMAGDKDITWELRQGNVDANVSIVAAHAGVRTALSAQQRKIGLRGKIVMVGRDIGTVVLPEADIKVYLDASAEERAKRRYNEVIARGETADYEKILEKIIERDHIDSTRAVAPLKPAEDAVILDSDKMSVEEVLAHVLELCK